MLADAHAHEPVLPDKTAPAKPVSPVAISSSSSRLAQSSKGNQLILGDADAALSGLLDTHLGSARLALIDPPYNTSSTFHHYLDREDSTVWLDVRRRHSSLIRQLLTEDGSVWMHLDDSELHYCKVMLDEVFGRANYVGTIVWQKTQSRENRTALSTTHEYLLVYAKNKRIWGQRRNMLPPTERQLLRYKNPDDDPRGPWTSGDLTAKAGPGRRAAQFYDLTAPSGRVLRPAPGMAWRFTRDRFDELLSDGRITFGPRGDNMPRLKRFLAETQGGLVPTTWWPGDEVGTSDSAKKQLRRLFPELVPFETPKPEELVARVIGIATDPGDVVVDCYAGSGTTPAVAHKMGRCWIAIEREPRTFDDFLKPRLDMVVGGETGGVSEQVGWVGGGDYTEVTASAAADEVAS